MIIKNYIKTYAKKYIKIYLKIYIKNMYYKKSSNKKNKTILKRIIKF